MDITRITADGKKLAKARKKANLTQEQVAEMVGVDSRQTISIIEKTGRTSSDVILRLAVLYGLDKLSDITCQKASA